jgi:hypothetical protein
MIAILLFVLYYLYRRSQNKASLPYNGDNKLVAVPFTGTQYGGIKPPATRNKEVTVPHSGDKSLVAVPFTGTQDKDSR